MEKRQKEEREKEEGREEREIHPDNLCKRIDLKNLKLRNVKSAIYGSRRWNKKHKGKGYTI